MPMYTPRVLPMAAPHSPVSSGAQSDSDHSAQSYTPTPTHALQHRNTLSISHICADDEQIPVFHQAAPKNRAEHVALAVTFHNDKAVASTSTALSFRTHVKHHVPLIDAQVRSGIVMVNRILMHLRKLVSSRETLCADIRKSIVTESAVDSDAMRSDAMNAHAAVLNKLIVYLSTHNDNERAYCAAVQESVLRPLSLWAKSADEMRLTIMRDEKRIAEEVAGKHRESDKLRAACIKAWEALVDCRKKRDASIAKGKPAEVNVQKLLRARDSCRALFLQFEILLANTQTRIAEYSQRELPSLLDRLSAIEFERMSVTQNALAAFGRLSQHYAQTIPPLIALAQSVSELSAESDMQSAIEEWISRHGLPPADTVATVTLPCRSDELLTDEWEQSMDRSLQPIHVHHVDHPRASLFSHAVKHVNATAAAANNLTRSASASESPSDAASNIKRLNKQPLTSNASAKTALSASDPSLIDTDSPLLNIIRTPTRSHSPVSPQRSSDPVKAFLSPTTSNVEHVDTDNEDDDDDLVEDDVRNKETWLFASVNLPHVPTHRGSLSESKEDDVDIAAVSVLLTPPLTPSSLSRPTPLSSYPLLQCAADDVIRVIRTDIGGHAGWLWGSVLGRDDCAPGRFHHSSTHAITDTPMNLSDASDAGEAEVNKPSLVDIIRNRVSKKKRRYQRDGFDLDLSYITPQLIAMGFPSENWEGLYRNPMSAVQDFLTKKHTHKAKVYNLCSERSYPADRFEHYVRYPFDDHNPSAFDMIEPFCLDVLQWIQQSKQHVVCIHCKAGKGRTGFLIACVLLYSHYCGYNYGFMDATTALRYYAVKRTKNARGVTIPSQIRYTHYWERVLRQRRLSLPDLPPVLNIILVSIRLYGTTRLIGKDVQCSITWTDGGKYTTKGAATAEHRIAEDYIVFHTAANAKAPAPIQNGLARVHGDVLCALTVGRSKLCKFWLNTRFLNAEHADAHKDATHFRRLDLPKSELDSACKDVAHKTFPEDFRVELIFATAPS